MRAFIRPLVVASTLLTAGCSMSGSWRTVRIEPPDGPFPIRTLSLDPAHNYTATWTTDGESRTSIGVYQFNGFTLDLLDAGFEPRTYSARKQWGGDLVLSHDSAAGRVTATLTPIQ